MRTACLVSCLLALAAVPALVALNRARERVRPSPAGGRKGGNPEDVMGLTLDA